ncbi:hypothetical protein BD289DRAFT_281832 [Coniella lustricola]|uniref:Zn(2)-C6 fungal-type domain-containing protein n=1 Tax=Coniella lustricola TaxID=2025994 RepID=A0A2T3A606_9PEZI|nr:hypothetical protein BD289DRAFT_281832 [Coniella lustricola]
MVAQSVLGSNEDDFDSMGIDTPLHQSPDIYSVRPGIIDDFFGRDDRYSTTPRVNTSSSTATATRTDQIPSPSSPAPAKRLACERCHNQKLRCARQQDKPSCDRCLAANATCAERIPRRLGRPHSTNASISKSTTARKRRQRTDAHKIASHQRNNSKAMNDSSSSSSSNSNSNNVSNDQSQGSPSVGLTIDLGCDTEGQGTVKQQHYGGAANLTLPSSVADDSRPTPWPSSAFSSPTDCPSPFDFGLGGSDGEPTATAAGFVDDACHQGHAVFDAPLVTGLDSLDAVMTELDEMPDPLVATALDMEYHPATPATAPAKVDTTTTATYSSPITATSVTTSCTKAHVQQDPVERLTSLHLELYQCLNSFRSIEQQCQHELDSFGATVALEWVERLFQSTEEFVNILRQGFGSSKSTTVALPYLGSSSSSCCSPASSCSSSSSSSTSPTNSSSSPTSSLGVGLYHHHHHQSSPESSPCSSTSPSPTCCAPVVHPLDSATSLMIVSCYVRLLQIYDSFAAVLPSTLDAAFAANNSLLGVRIGGFCPSVIDKRLGSAVVAQYVCLLLESIRTAVETALLVDDGSGGDNTVMVPMHAAVHGPTLVEARASEVALRGRIASSMNLLVPSPQILV